MVAILLSLILVGSIIARALIRRMVICMRIRAFRAESLEHFRWTPTVGLQIDRFLLMTLLLGARDLGLHSRHFREASVDRLEIQVVRTASP